MLRPLLLLVIIGLYGCSTLQTSNDWPADLPPKKLFINYYQKDKDHQKVLSQEDYLRWIKRFYLGWELYSRGWLQTSQELSNTMKSPQESQQVAQKMDTLGRLIAPEWAKDDQYRVINTRHLSIWGNALNQSIINKDQLSLLKRIESDVRSLLTKSLQTDMITSDRYYQDTSFEQQVLLLD